MCGVPRTKAVKGVAKRSFRFDSDSDGTHRGPPSPRLSHEGTDPGADSYETAARRAPHYLPGGSGPQPRATSDPRGPETRRAKDFTRPTGGHDHITIRSLIRLKVSIHNRPKIRSAVASQSRFIILACAG